MLAETFSHGLIRNFVIAFGTLFNNIKINRPAARGEGTNTIAIPLTYAPRQRYIERINEDLSLDKPVALSLPRMSFEMVSLNYAAERKLNTMQRYYGRKDTTSNTQIASTYAPVPYDINFQLNCYVENIEDGTHIIEQILPFFTPEFTVSLKSVTDLGINMDLPVVLNAINSEDSYESGFDERRVIIWTLDFTMKTHLFGPVDNGGLINKIMVNLYPTVNVAASANTNEQVYITPGQFANGLATNTSYLSVQPNLISANSDYGISSKIFGVGQDKNVYKYWDFRGGLHTSTVGFGPGAGTTAYDGWHTYESEEFAENGTVVLEAHDGQLRQYIIKTVEDGSYQEEVYLQIYANTNPDYVFDQFYGKNFQEISVRFKTKQVVGTGAIFNYRGVLRWLTTDSAEQNWTEDALSGRYLESSDSGYVSSNYDSLSQDYKTVTFDLSGQDDWNNRIITALRFELLNAAAPNDTAAMFIQTDIDYIKIAVKE